MTKGSQNNSHKALTTKLATNKPDYTPHRERMRETLGPRNSHAPSVDQVWKYSGEL